MKKIIIWGATGQLIVLEEFLLSIGFEIISIFDNNEDIISPFPEIPLYHKEEGFQQWRTETFANNINCLVAIGGSNGKDRIEIQKFLEKEGINPIIAIHPTAFIASSVKIGKGSQILANSSICAKTKLGLATIINTSASVDHECNIGQGVHIGPGATLAGCVTIDDYSFVGTGAIILPRIKIGKNVIIGAGAVVTKNIPDNVIVYGNPAKIIRRNL